MKKERGSPSNSPEKKQSSEEKFSLYKFLQLEQGPIATIDQIKKQYKKLVIKYHPDKNQGCEKARQQFQKLKQAYDILMDPEKRKLYDETGVIEGDSDERAFQTAYDYMRTMFKKVEKEDIEEFEKKYRFGEMEEEDLIDFYENHEGNLVTLLQCIPLSRNEDIERFVDFFEKQVQEKRLKNYTNFAKTKNKVKLLPDETKQWEQEQQKKNDMSNLILAIKNKDKGSFLAALEEKYCKKPEKKKVIEKKGNKKKKTK